MEKSGHLVYTWKSEKSEYVKVTRWCSIQVVRTNRIMPTAVKRGTVETVISWIDVMTCPMLINNPTSIAASSSGIATQKAASMVRRASSTTCSAVMDIP